MTLEVSFTHQDIRIGGLTEQAIGIQQLRAGFDSLYHPFTNRHRPCQPGKNRIQVISHITAFITQRKAAVERQLHIGAVSHTIVTQGATEASRLNALQFWIRHSRYINQPTHPEESVQEETRKVHHTFIGIALQEGVHHYRRFFKVAGKIAQTITRRLRNIISPRHGNRPKNIRIDNIVVEVEHGSVKTFKRI